MVKYARLIQVTMLALTALLVVSLLPRLGNAQSNGSLEIRFASDLKITPAIDLKVHKLLAQPVARDEFIALSNRVLEKVEPNANLRKQFKLDQAKLDDGSFSYVQSQDPSSSIIQDSKTGDLVFQNQVRRFLTLDNVNLLSKQAAVTEARRFIDDVGLKPLDFENNGKLLYTSNIIMQECKDGAYSDKTTKLQTLHFGREIDGIAVQGPGSKIVMQLGDQGRVVSLTKKWNAFTPTLKLTPQGTEAIKDLKVRTTMPGATDTIKPAILPGVQKLVGKTQVLKATPYFTEDEVKNNIIKEIRSNWTSADYVEVQDIELVYYDRSGEYIQPVYAVEAVLHWGDEAIDYLFHMPALKDPPESLASSFATPGSGVMFNTKPLPPPKAIIEKS